MIKHALRNALIAPFTVIMLQFPWLLTGVVIVETMFRYQGFGFLLVEAAGNNDIDLLLGCSLVSVMLVLVTQLISDIGYAYLNPRIRVQLRERMHGNRRRLRRSSSACIVRFWPVWLALAIVLGASFAYKKQLGLYGQLFDTGVGIAGVADLLLLAVHGDLRRRRSRPSIR